MDLMTRYPALSDLRARARQRLPRFVWDYLDSGTGDEATTRRNQCALDRIGLTPSVLHGEFTPDLSATFLGQDHPLPFGIAPVGMSGLIWPGAERLLAAHAAETGIPYTLSTVATAAPEDISDALGADAWFQIYPPRDPDIRADLLARAQATGFSTLVMTVDVPVASRRERQTRGGVTNPPRLTPRLLAQIARCPAWALATARAGMPHMRTLDKYAPDDDVARPVNAHVGYLLRTSPDWDYVSALRDAWDGPFIVKGVLRPGDAERLAGLGVDALWISNHAGRQFDAAPATIDVLPAMRAASKLPLIFDSGVRGGLDILRALASGADFVMMGRAWHYALAALEEDGPPHLTALLKADLEANMGQLGARTLGDLPKPFALH